MPHNADGMANNSFAVYNGNARLDHFRGPPPLASSKLREMQVYSGRGANISSLPPSFVL